MTSLIATETLYNVEFHGWFPLSGGYAYVRLCVAEYVIIVSRLRAGLTRLESLAHVHSSLAFDGCAWGSYPSMSNCVINL